MLIYFVEKSIPFNSNDLNSNFIGGTEKVLINISNELAKINGIKVKVFNENVDTIKLNNVEWINLRKNLDYSAPDVLISFSDMNLLNLFKSKKKFLWSHSVQNIEKFIRKKQLVPYLLNKPIIILEGEYHFKNRSSLLSLFGKNILKLAPDYEFINEKVDINFLPPKKCIFTTKSDRNLDILLEMWSKIHLLNKDAELSINPPFEISESLSKLNIKLREKGEKKNLIKDLKLSRIMLIPGHKGEVFCLAAEEARELCLPIVTMGYGSLSERVNHNVTGYIAKNKDEFIRYTHNLLNDDVLYRNFRSNLLKNRNNRTYYNVAMDLLKIIDN